VVATGAATGHRRAKPFWRRPCRSRTRPTTSWSPTNSIGSVAWSAPAHRLRPTSRHTTPTSCPPHSASLASTGASAARASANCQRPPALPFGQLLRPLAISLRSLRRVNNDHTIDFEGQNFEISATLRKSSATLRKSVTLLHQPNLRFWVLEHPPMDIWPPPILADFILNPAKGGADVAQRRRDAKGCALVHTHPAGECLLVCICFFFALLRPLRDIPSPDLGLFCNHCLVLLRQEIQF